MATPPQGAAVLEKALALALAAGAEAADAILFAETALSATVRLGAREDIARAETTELGLRVFIGGRQAMASSADLKPHALAELAARAVAMARLAPPDPYAGLADPSRLSRGTALDLDLDDGVERPVENLFAAALASEDAARAVPGVSNSEGASAHWSRSHMRLATSAGFEAAQSATASSLSVSVIAGEGNAMERDYAFSSARHWTDLEAPETVGRRAGNRAVRRLLPTRIKTGAMPVVFDPRVAGGLVSHFAAAINGQAVARGTSFLRKKMAARVFAPGIRIVDDPLRRRGLRSRPFDGEGVASKPCTLVADGVLESWLLDSATARQLGLATTGHAARAPASAPAPAPSNLYLAPGAVTPAALIEDMSAGFYVTELIGMGVNPVTGDYSRGAAGFLIENGEVTRPVAEVTIAGNLLDMFAALTPANDLQFRYGIDAPSLRIETMMVAGA
ncbi:MAG: TldD/PmbA family protein [Pseudomonadota bacterium]